MTTHTADLAALHAHLDAHPDDWTARLVLADLLTDLDDEQGAAVRYRRALRCIAEGLTVDPVTGRLEPMTMDDARWFAKGQIEERR